MKREEEKKTDENGADERVLSLDTAEGWARDDEGGNRIFHLGPPRDEYRQRNKRRARNSKDARCATLRPF